MSKEFHGKVPEGYYVTHDQRYGLRLIREDNNEQFSMTNRSFWEVNCSFRKLPERLIEHGIANDDDNRIKILDVAGGYKSHAAKEIAENYEGNAVVFNIDRLAQEEDATENFQPIPASVDALPLEDNSVDFVYSHMMIPYLKSLESPFDDPSIDRVSVVDALKEMTRVVRPGGVIVTDNEFVGKYSEEDPQKDELDEVLESKVTRKDGGLFLGPLDALNRFVDKNYPYYSRILIIQKEPVDHDTNSVIEAVPDKLKRWETNVVWPHKKLDY